MNRNFICLALLTLTLFAARPVLAQNVYFVDPVGSDSAAGSAVAPWATLQHAVDSVGPGDTITVRAGTYVGCRITRAGTAEAYITLQAADGAAVVVNGAGPSNRKGSGVELEMWDGAVAYWTIKGLEVTGAESWGIDVRGTAEAPAHHVNILNNTVHHNGLTTGRTGIFLAFVDDALIEGNRSYNNGEHGVYCSNSGDRPVVRGNTIYDNVACGLHMNGDESAGGDGIISGALVENNVIYGNGAEGGAGVNNDGVTDSVFRNNLLYNNHAGGFAVFQENGAVCSQNNKYYNNTVVQADDGRWAFNIAQAGCTGNKIFNNILYINSEWRGAITIPTHPLAGFESNYNVVVNRFSSDDDQTIIDLAAWRALGYDANSLLASPEELFVNAAGGDYRLKETAPAVDAGTCLAEVTVDLAGTARPYGAGCDIGAYEYSPGSSSSGWITYALADHTVYRLQAASGATPESVSDRLDALSPRRPDEWLNISPDGQWLLMSTERFEPECAGWACLALAPIDLSSAAVIKTGGSVVRAPTFSAVASGGNLVVFTSNDGPHTQDLFVTSRQGDGWSSPQLLTGQSPYDYHEYPAISADGTKVIMAANPVAYADEGKLIAEVGVDGQGFRTILTPAQAPAGRPSGGNLHHPDFAPDGSYVFEADWGAEQIWRLAAAGAEPTIIGGELNNDNSPCVLTDSRIVTLWLDRPGGEGFHEIKVMNADGSSYYMALTGVDVHDIGMGCGQ